MKNYYYEQNGKPIGPVSLEELEKKVFWSTLVWREGLDDWVKAKDLPELKGFFTVPPPLQKSTKKQWKYFVEKNKNILIICLFFSVLVFGSLVFFNATENENEILKQKQQNLIKNKYDLVKENEELIEQISQIEKEKEEKALQEKEAEREREYVKKNWRDYISYEVGKVSIDYNFGGVAPFQITVSNKSKYYIDRLSLYIIYIKKNGEKYKQEEVTVKNLAPNSFEVIQAPSSSRGTKIHIDYSRVICNEIGLDL